MSSFSQILPWRNSNLWKGIGLGIGVCVLTLAIAIPNMLRSKVATRQFDSFDTYERVEGGGGGGGGSYARLVSVQADGPKIVRSAELNLLVADCSASLKKVEELAKAESGFVESSTLREDAADITLRVPSGRLDQVRARLREFAVRVVQDSVGASDVTRQYYDSEARLRNLRAQEQQYLGIMKKAHTVPDVLAVTKSLDEVREQIEQDDAEFRRMKDQVELAKIEVHLHSQSVAGMHWSAGASTRTAWNDLLQSLASLGDFLIWLVINIPVIVLWVVIVFLLVAVGWYVLRVAFRAMKSIFGRKVVAEKG
ncbi:MAG TPA: DUF4349 domain-containing protein [Candidatus Angelobacter sp.]|nr:DUF4349 domain-containing protein [Candidatus Angelobacter sp.]